MCCPAFGSPQTTWTCSEPIGGWVKKRLFHVDKGFDLFLSKKKNLICSSPRWKWFVRNTFGKNSLVKKKTKWRRRFRKKRRDGWLTSTDSFLFSPQLRAKNYFHLNQEQRIIQAAAFVKKKLYKHSYPTNFTRKIGSLKWDYFWKKNLKWYYRFNGMRSSAVGLLDFSLQSQYINRRPIILRCSSAGARARIS